MDQYQAEAAKCLGCKMNSQVSQNRRVKKSIINQLETEVVRVTCSYLITDIIVRRIEK